jgi:hypothetical protein
MGTKLTGEAYEFYNNMLIAADMLHRLEDREVIYAIMKAAEDATLRNINPRYSFYLRSEQLDIELDMRFKNWKHE